jgi:hypothetical protein
VRGTRASSRAEVWVRNAGGAAAAAAVSLRRCVDARPGKKQAARAASDAFIKRFAPRSRAAAAAVYSPARAATRRRRTALFADPVVDRRRRRQATDRSGFWDTIDLLSAAAAAAAAANADDGLWESSKLPRATQRRDLTGSRAIRAASRRHLHTYGVRQVSTYFWSRTGVRSHLEFDCRQMRPHAGLRWRPRHSAFQTTYPGYSIADAAAMKRLIIGRGRRGGRELMR